ncbi:MAG: M23 family metallopeptidase [Micavibrio sp.]|nr:M23 family metallopeptidase [Micavibrio sp.]
MSKIIRLIGLFLILGCFPAHAAELKLDLPLDCEIGKDCWIARYNDVDAAKGKVADFTCERRTEDGHEGIDFALRSRLEMTKGVDVRAAADGTVLRYRDGESDEIKSDEDIRAISAANKDCGNGVIIQHKGGLQSFYCHMKAGSIMVRPNEKVMRGQKIGQVGQSGAAQFPHLHFSIIRDKGRIDPFTGFDANEGCGMPKKSMWAPEIEYQPFAVFDGGFAADVPDFKEIEKGQEIVKTLPASSDNLVFWVGFYHGVAGDRIDMQITAPNGRKVSERTVALDKDRARQYYYTGLKLRQTLPKGIYKGQATFTRAGVKTVEFSREIEVK